MELAEWQALRKIPTKRLITKASQDWPIGIAAGGFGDEGLHKKHRTRQAGL
jgi:hypothetical protein